MKIITSCINKGCGNALPKDDAGQSKECRNCRERVVPTSCEQPLLKEKQTPECCEKGRKCNIEHCGNLLKKRYPKGATKCVLHKTYNDGITVMCLTTFECAHCPKRFYTIASFERHNNKLKKPEINRKKYKYVRRQLAIVYNIFPYPGKVARAIVSYLM